VSLTQIFLTALATVVGGALTLAVGQIIVRGALEPALELKRLIGTIASDLEFYANKFQMNTPEEKQKWREIFRKHSCSLMEKLNVIIWYSIFEPLFQLPPEKDVRGAAINLIEYSNRPDKAEPDWGPLPDKEIKRQLRIKT
jgi:hypothetical protein